MCSKRCSLILLVLLASVLIARHFIRPNIHSCDIYIPRKVEFTSNLISSLAQFYHAEGAAALTDVANQIVRDSLLSVPAFFDATPLQGKNFLMVGGSYITEFLQRSRHFGANIYLIDDAERTPPSARELVVGFIAIEDFGRVSILEPERVIRAAVAAKVRFDGVFTLVEDEGPLTARLAERFAVPGNTYESALRARNKLQVRAAMEKLGLSVPKYAPIEGEHSLAGAAAKLGFPAFLKPIYGVAASFASKVRSEEHLRSTYLDYQSRIDPVAHPIYYFGKEMMLEGLLVGVEVQLELMMLEGNVVFHSFSSSYDTNRAYLVFPAALSERARSEMLELAQRTARDAVGISNGIVHCELFWDDVAGAQLIEINNRLSRGFLPRHFTYQLLNGYTHTDYHAAALFLSLGLPPPVLNRTLPVVSLAVFPDHPSKTGWETEGDCAVFVAPNPFEAIRLGERWRKSHEHNEL